MLCLYFATICSFLFILASFVFPSFQFQQTTNSAFILLTSCAMKPASELNFAHTVSEKKTRLNINSTFVQLLCKMSKPWWFYFERSFTA